MFGYKKGYNDENINRIYKVVMVDVSDEPDNVEDEDGEALMNEAVNRKRISLYKNVIKTYNYANVFQITTNSAGFVFIDTPSCLLNKIFRLLFVDNMKFPCI